MCRFQRHAGYDGVTLGLPGSDYHLEFTSHVDGGPGRVGALTFEDPDGWRVVLVPKPVAL